MGGRDDWVRPARRARCRVDRLAVLFIFFQGTCRAATAPPASLLHLGRGAPESGVPVVAGAGKRRSRPPGASRKGPSIPAGPKGAPLTLSWSCPHRADLASRPQEPPIGSERDFNEWVRSFSAVAGPCALSEPPIFASAPRRARGCLVVAVGASATGEGFPWRCPRPPPPHLEHLIAPHTAPHAFDARERGLRRGFVFSPHCSRPFLVCLSTLASSLSPLRTCPRAPAHVGCPKKNFPFLNFLTPLPILWTGR